MTLILITGASLCIILPIVASKYTSNKIIITPVEQPVKGVTLTHYTGYMYDEETFEALKSNTDIDVKGEIEDTGASIIDFILIYVVPFLLVYLLFGL